MRERGTDDGLPFVVPALAGNIPFRLKAVQQAARKTLAEKTSFLNRHRSITAVNNGFGTRHE